MTHIEQSGAVSLLSRLLAPVMFIAVLIGLYLYPYARLELGAGLAICAALGAWRPNLLLFLLPPWLALVNLAPWSGSLYIEDYDLFLGMTLGVLLAKGLYASRIRLTLGEWTFLGLLTLSYAVSMMRGLLPIPEWSPVELASYYSQWNALRLSKGYFWALALFPGLVALLRQDQKLARGSLVWGLALSGGAMGLVAMWERGVFNALLASGDPYDILKSLLDFTTPYRVTGLFSEMHTGGEAIDGFVALVWPFTLLAAATSRSRMGMLLGSLTLAGILYTGVTTFSRATYLALLAGIAVGGLLWLLSHRNRIGIETTQAFAALPGLLAPLALAFIFIRGGMQTLAVGLAGWAIVLVAGYLASRGRPAFWRIAGIGIACASAWGMAHGMLSSRWVANTTLLAWLLGGLAAALAGAGAFTTGRRLGPLIGARGIAVVMAVIVSGVGIVTPAVLGYRMDVRLSTTDKDIGTREAHWKDALSIMKADLATTLLGMGVGRFPATYLWAHSTDSMGSYRFLPADKSGKDYYLALGSGQDLRFTQRVSLPAYQTYTLTLDVRTSAPNLWLQTMLYRRNMILPNEWPGQHIKFDPQIENTHGKWKRLTWTFTLDSLGDGAEAGRHPLVLELMNWRKYEFVNLPGTVLDIDNVSLRDAQGRELLANGDFSRGLERWFPHYDFNHLPWHVKNLWVNVYFDQGMLGVLGLAGFLAATIFAAVKRGLQGDPWGLAVSASMASFLAVGLFGGLLDMPRIIFICYLMLFVTALSGPIRRRRVGQRISSPDSAVQAAVNQ